VGAAFYLGLHLMTDVRKEGKGAGLLTWNEKGGKGRQKKGNHRRRGKVFFRNSCETWDDGREWPTASTGWGALKKSEGGKFGHVDSSCSISRKARGRWGGWGETGDYPAEKGRWTKKKLKPLNSSEERIIWASISRGKILKKPKERKNIGKKRSGKVGKQGGTGKVGRIGPEVLKSHADPIGLGSLIAVSGITEAKAKRRRRAGWEKNKKRKEKTGRGNAYTREASNEGRGDSFRQNTEGAEE